jgi:hypothetical protein
MLDVVSVILRSKYALDLLVGSSGCVGRSEMAKFRMFMLFDVSRGWSGGIGEEPAQGCADNRRQEPLWRGLSLRG